MTQIIQRKGRKIFSFQEIKEIERLIEGIRNSDGTEQRRSRRRLRKLEFYISDFDRGRAGLTVERLRQLIRDREIILLK